MNTIVKKPKKQGNPKNKIYEKEQKEVLEKLYKITGVTNTNKLIAFYDVESDQKKIDSLLALKDDIKKYFKASSSDYKEVKKEHISVIKNVLNQMKISFVTTKKNLHRNGVSHTSMVIVII